MKLIAYIIITYGGLNHNGTTIYTGNNSGTLYEIGFDQELVSGSTMTKLQNYLATEWSL